MSFLKNIFSKKDEPIKTNADFWNWFQKHEKTFYKAVADGSNIDQDFFEKLSPKLNELGEGFYLLTGIINNTIAELIITADGQVKNMVFAEELVQAAPTIANWKFTALKPPLDISNVSIEMDRYVYNSNNLFFYHNNFSQFPDEIDVTIVYKNFNEEHKDTITNGTCIFLDNYLGELHFAEDIDNYSVEGPHEDNKELIPIEKLKDYLVWRKTEFIEKYQGVRYNTENDNYVVLEAKLKNDNMLVAVVNQSLLNWEAKASHPWILTIEIKYNGTANNGMPDNETLQSLTKIEEIIIEQLKDFDGYLNIGRQTANNEREIYFACKEFRKPSKVMRQIQNQFLNEFEITFEIYKDKYWQTFDKFKTKA